MKLGEIMSICDLSPAELTMTVTALGNAIADALPKKELILLNSLLKQLSDVIGTIVAQRDLCSCTPDKPDKNN